MLNRAMIQTAHQIGNLLVDQNGLVTVNAGRPWVDINGRSYIAVNDANGNLIAQEIQTNATLRKDDWINLDQAVRMIATQRLAGINDLRAAGLVYPAGDLGSTIAEWEASSDMTDAEINMAGTTTSEKDRQAFSLAGVPIPIIRKDFDINTRNLLASRRRGAGLDVTSAQTATRLVAEASENLLFNGDTSIVVGGYSLPGYTTHSSRVTGVLGAPWSGGSVTGEGILNDVHDMISGLENVKHYGPYMLYVNSTMWPSLRKDYSSAKGDNTILERILAEDVIQGVRVSDKLGSDSVVMVQMTSDVVDLAVAQDITTVNWQSGDGMNNSFAVFSAWVPRLKPDYDGNLGIAHYTTST